MKATQALLPLLGTAAGLVFASPITTANNAVASAEVGKVGSLLSSPIPVPPSSDTSQSPTTFSTLTTTASNQAGVYSTSHSPSSEESMSSHKARAWESGKCQAFRYDAEMWKECVKPLEACVPYASEEEEWDKCLEGLDKK